jgi:O-antigen ligase
MFNKSAEKTVSRLILLGAPAATLFIVTDTVTDPVNAPKLFISGALGFSLFFLFIAFNLRENFRNFSLFILVILLFLLSALNTIFQSEAPISQQMYGVFGRNTGFVAYLLLSMIAIGALHLREKVSFKYVIFGLQFTGFVNVVYCTWVLAFGDFLKWTNPYGNILGLFGNPDFISAFLGIFITSLVAYSFNQGISNYYRAIAGVTALLAFYEVHRSHAIQGVAVTAAGLGVVGFYVIRGKFKSKLLSSGYLLLFATLGLTAVFGALQKGPLDFIYKRSVSLRGIYWNTAINMAKEKPFSGVGLDSYGDWFRQARPLKALTDPGVNTTSNAAHNVVLDFLANGGWPLLLSYLATILLGAVSIFRVTVRQKNYDGVFVTLAASWICYELQSIISINQIGLAIWGWLLTGAVIAYEFSTRNPKEDVTAIRSKQTRSTQARNSGVISPQLVAGIGVVFGLLVACPPMAADTKWRSALNSKDANRVIQALNPGYLSPSDSQRYAQAVQLFANSNLLDQAHTIALEAVKFNPYNFQSWRNLYFLSNSTAAEKALAVENLKRLDPLNPDVTKP